jgi:cytidine deaminase
MLTPDQATLLHEAQSAALGAYAPYSRFRVGAALIAGGATFRGCNVENASFGLAICAERNAIFHAVAAGHRRIETLALACIDAPAEAAASLMMPCGACRQVMAEFAGPDLPVIIAGVGLRRLRDLLPEAFILGS